MFRALGRVVVVVSDQEEALRFYRDVLGFQTLHDEDAGGFRYLHVGLPGQDHVGLWLMPGSAPPAQQPLLVLYTDDLDEVRRRLAENAVEVWAEREDESSRSLHFRDVDGNVIVAAQLQHGV
jgi:predicted enzyme related to lactoylglutathione lyase